MNLVNKSTDQVSRNGSDELEVRCKQIQLRKLGPSQRKVFDLLRVPITIKEIMQSTGMSYNVVVSKLFSLRHAGLVEKARNGCYQKVDDTMQDEILNSTRFLSERASALVSILDVPQTVDSLSEQLKDSHAAIMSTLRQLLPDEQIKCKRIGVRDFYSLASVSDESFIAEARLHHTELERWLLQRLEEPARIDEFVHEAGTTRIRLNIALCQLIWSGLILKIQGSRMHDVLYMRADRIPKNQMETLSVVQPDAPSLVITREHRRAHHLDKIEVCLTNPLSFEGLVECTGESEWKIQRGLEELELAGKLRCVRVQNISFFGLSKLSDDAFETAAREPQTLLDRWLLKHIGTDEPISADQLAFDAPATRRKLNMALRHLIWAGLLEETPGQSGRGIYYRKLKQS